MENKKRETDFFIQNHSATFLISKLLSEVGIKPSFKGYNYCRSAVLEILDVPMITNVAFKQIYEKLALQYATKPVCIDRNIRYAIETAWAKGNLNVIYKMFGYTVQADKGKPTNAEFLVMIADHVKLQRLHS